MKCTLFTCLNILVNVRLFYNATLLRTISAVFTRMFQCKKLYFKYVLNEFLDVRQHLALTRRCCITF